MLSSIARTSEIDYEFSVCSILYTNERTAQEENLKGCVHLQTLRNGRNPDVGDSIVHFEANTISFIVREQQLTS